MIVYWLRDNSCSIPESSGYVGITRRKEQRFREHAKSGRFPKDVTFEVLFEGEKKECVDLERRLRPSWNIGWNIAPGGDIPPSPLGKKHPWVSEANRNRQYAPKTEEQKRKASIAAKARYAADSTLRHKAGNGKRGRPSWSKGVAKPLHVRMAISYTLRGRSVVWPTRTCPHCGIECNTGTYARWHGDKCAKGVRGNLPPTT